MQQQDFHLQVEKMPQPFRTPRNLSEIEPRVKSFREKKQTWVPKVNRIEKKHQPNITQPEHYSGGKRMSPVKLMYSIKQRIDEQIAEANGKPTAEAVQTGVEKSRNFHRFKDAYMIGSRAYDEPLPDIVEGSQYTRNVEIIGKMLNHHAEFQEAMNRKV